MTSITGDYLVHIIERCINRTICHRHNGTAETITPGTTAVSNEDIVDFIVSIPYLDTKLKNFIVGNDFDQTIISQAWENEFIKKCMAWATDDMWLQNSIPVLKHIYVKMNSDTLTLPY